MLRTVFCLHTGTTSGGPRAHACLAEGLVRLLVPGHLVPAPCLSQPLAISQEIINLEKRNPLKRCPVPSFLTDSHLVIVIKQCWWNTWLPFSRSLPSQRDCSCYRQTPRKYTDPPKNRYSKTTSSFFEAKNPASPPLLQGKVCISLQHLGKIPVLLVNKSLFCFGWICI